MGSLGLEIEKGLYLGIDFGTTNSVVSIYNYDDDEVITIPIDGNKLFPSIIQFDESYEEDGTLVTYFGVQAREAAVIYPRSTVSSVKRLLEGEQPIKITVSSKEYVFKAEDITARILAHLKEKADEYLREELLTLGEFTGCVITVPANSTDKQKTRTKNAAIKAGFNEEHIFLRLEPAAAAIHYAINEKSDKKVLIYDFGGGTFDACILDIVHKESEPNVTICSTYGNNRLGGNDIDSIMMDIVYDEFLRLTNNEINLFDEDSDSGDKKMAILRLNQAANLAKERLSSAKTTRIVLAPFIQEPTIVNINLEITRELFVSHVRKHQLTDEYDDFLLLKDKNIIDLVAETMNSVDRCLEAANLIVENIDEVFLVGGSSAIPEVKIQITNKFSKEPYLSKISPAFSISNGAAHYCNLIMSNSSNKLKVNEVTVHPLGLEIAGRRFLKIMDEGELIPKEGLIVEAKELLETNYDDISSMSIIIYEDTKPDANRVKFVYEDGMKRLGGTTLRGIPAKEKGLEKVRIEFYMNQDNILTVKAQSINDEGVNTKLSVDDMY